MRKIVVATVLAAATATAAAAAPKLVYKVDSVTVSTNRNQMVVTANGAVNSGGWTLPHLQRKTIHTPKSDTQEFEFLATPPPSDAIVIQALLPVSATGRFPLPRNSITQVKVVGETNSVMAPVH